ncbi:hypothetical protein EJ110_NYTH48472 [Nymphaea thermarum]|nr:hypothetical protein EJ110_NYTH48472 [Nymphaea thermarum]
MIMIALIRFVDAQPLLLNVDCGTTGAAKGYLGLTWAGEEQYVRSGESARVRKDHPQIPVLNTLRYFPTGKKNCYTFPGVGQGIKIIARASFYNGNYDGLSSPPTFDVFLNGNFWGSFVRKDVYRNQLLESIYITKADDISVCLIRTYPTDIPFINAFEIRELDQSMYSSMDIHRPLHVSVRLAYASPNFIRYNVAILNYHCSFSFSISLASAT